MQNQSQRLVIDVTYSNDDTGAKTTLNSVKNAMGSDITDSFRAYAVQQGFSLITSDGLATAAGEYARAHA
ncbi:hypothetical protein GCM10009094_38700 [Massilia aurea]